MVAFSSPPPPSFSTFNSCSSFTVAHSQPRSRRDYRMPYRPRRAACISANAAENYSKKDPSAAKPVSHMTVELARQAFDDALVRHGNDIQKLAQVCAEGFVDALKRCYSDDDFTCVFIACGHGLTGLIGLYSAKLLKQHGYDAAVYASVPSKYIDTKEFCERHKISLYDFAPSTVEFYYQLVVDALLGVGFDGGDLTPPYWGIYELLFSVELPVISVDVPSGWDLTTGPRPIDVSADSFIKPHVLVSLGAPKICAKRFAGSFHYVAGKHLDQQYFKERGISIPSYPGGSSSVLFESSSIKYLGNGAVYGSPGQFNATLHKRTPRRRYVDIDDDMDLWDELD